jgi:hypothetical protein
VCTTPVWGPEGDVHCWSDPAWIRSEALVSIELLDAWPLDVGLSGCKCDTPGSSCKPPSSSDCSELRPLCPLHFRCPTQFWKSGWGKRTYVSWDHSWLLTLSKWQAMIRECSQLTVYFSYDVAIHLACVSILLYEIGAETGLKCNTGITLPWALAYTDSWSYTLLAVMCPGDKLSRITSRFWLHTTSGVYQQRSQDHIIGGEGVESGIQSKKILIRSKP